LAVGAGAQAIDNRGGLMITQGNQSVVHIIHQYGAAESVEADLRPQIGRYLEWVLDKYGTIELRGIKREGRQVMQLALETVYVPLAATVYRQQSARDRQMAEPLEETPVEITMQQLLSRPPPDCDRRARLRQNDGAAPHCLGAGPGHRRRQPGPGRGTAGANRPAAAAHLHSPERLRPLPARTAPAADPHKRTLAAYISHYLIENQAGFDLPPDFFQQLLRQGEGVILLLDGLDEVPNEAERVKVREAIERLVTGRDNMRVVVTCRTAAYQGRTALGKGFREVKTSRCATTISPPWSSKPTATFTRQTQPCRLKKSGNCWRVSPTWKRNGGDGWARRPPLVDSPCWCGCCSSSITASGGVCRSSGRSCI
jgi:hypothetical protein